MLLVPLPIPELPSVSACSSKSVDVVDVLLRLWFGREPRVLLFSLEELGGGGGGIGGESGSFSSLLF